MMRLVPKNSWRFVAAEVGGPEGSLGQPPGCVAAVGRTEAAAVEGAGAPVVSTAMGSPELDAPPAAVLVPLPEAFGVDASDAKCSLSSASAAD